MPSMRFFAALCAGVILSLGQAFAADPKAEMDAAMQAANTAMQKGPADIGVAGQAKLKLPENFGFIPAKESRRLLEAMGNRTSDETQGLIIATGGQNANWFMVVGYTPAGYIKDDDAKTWNADELLNSLREGTEEANKERKSRNIPEMEIVGWVEKPLYDAASQRLVWSLASHDKGQASGADNGINYNTLVLGREGYVSMNLVTGMKEVEALKPVAKNMLAAMAFDSGKRYADFNAGTDKVAEYGLAALVAGVAAKKLGLLAVIGVFLAKFAKIIIAAVAVGGGVLGKKLWNRKKGNEAA
ncbi:MAG: DUF2167 domain-containing protein [Hydrogenophilales bacterium]|nr:DUF2167 domain-containing protein [Hydrogenophilales bacterium]